MTAAATCRAKTRFETRAQALRWMAERRYGAAVYECPVCSGWHLTSRTMSPAEIVRQAEPRGSAMGAAFARALERARRD